MTPPERLLIIQHAEVETPGIIQDILESSGIRHATIRTFNGDRVPDRVGGYSGLLMMGGPMSVYDFDRYPHLIDELSLTKSFIDKGKPILGICLGSQILAAALGARVTRGKMEIGWHKVRLHDHAAEDPLWRGIEKEFKAFHWHGDIFQPPPASAPLASTRMTINQGFRFGRAVYGLLFHMEMTEAIINGLLESYPDDLPDSETDERKIKSGAKKYLPALQEKGKKFFNSWLSLTGK